MGLDVYLEDEFGEELESFMDEGGALAAAWPCADPAFPILRHVDTEGTTLFNRLQLLAAAGEFAALEQKSPAALKISRMAKKAAAEPHLYLRFLGD